MLQPVFQWKSFNFQTRRTSKMPRMTWKLKFLRTIEVFSENDEVLMIFHEQHVSHLEIIVLCADFVYNYYCL